MFTARLAHIDNSHSLIDRIQRHIACLAWLAPRDLATSILTTLKTKLTHNSYA